MDAIELTLFQSRAQSVCEEMGVVLRRSAFSPNIKDRLDFSCALFAPSGAIFAQAAHIPVHLGSMAFAMSSIVGRFDWRPGDLVVLNDPFLGGTHLPDVTLIAPVFADARLCAFAATRAHHANIGADEPGSMPLSRTLAEEGVVLPPSLLLRDGVLQPETFARLLPLVPGALGADDWRTRAELADFRAQASACTTGVARTGALCGQMGGDAFALAIGELDRYGERLSRHALAAIPQGEFRFVDLLDDDGQGHVDLPIAVCVRHAGDRIDVDFAGTATQVDGNVNCPLSVTAAAVYYVFRCLMPRDAPAVAGAFAPIALEAEEGLLVNARRPAAVAAGNVETSMRIVDAVQGALAQALPDRVAAASQGTMNNVAMGARSPGGRWDYYETIAGGHGGGPLRAGVDARHAHMTNTRNTPIESLEAHYPLRVRRYSVRRGSGGLGRHRGGDGIVREIEFLSAARVSLLTERRRRGPWGLAGGGDGGPGRNVLNGTELPAKCAFTASAGDRLLIETPGGGGFGAPVEDDG